FLIGEVHGPFWLVLVLKAGEKLELISIKNRVLRNASQVNAAGFVYVKSIIARVGFSRSPTGMDEIAVNIVVPRPGIVATEIQECRNGELIAVAKAPIRKPPRFAVVFRFCNLAFSQMRIGLMSDPQIQHTACAQNSIAFAFKLCCV